MHIKKNFVSFIFVWAGGVLFPVPHILYTSLKKLGYNICSEGLLNRKTIGNKSAYNITKKTTKCYQYTVVSIR